MPLRIPDTIQPLREVRVQRRMTQAELARALHVPQQTISHLERSGARLTRRRLALLCRVLNTKPEQLFTRTVLVELERRVREAASAVLTK